ncbi:MAG: hypothetical protein RIT45_2611, partial [Pseudomonadota bacterium]
MKSTTLPMNFASLTALAVFALAGCSQPAEPTLACQSDSDCNNGQVCKVGRCLAPDAFICTATTECDAALANGSWKPTETGVCLQTACNDSVCEMVARAVGTACDDDDGLACTQGACDDAGACQAGASIAANTCVIDDNGTKSCVDADANNPANGCQACIPDIDAKGWTDKPMGAGCDDADGLSCTHGTCNGGGECQAAGIDSGACVIDQKCVKQGDAREGTAGCQVCDPGASQSQWTSLPEAATCSEDGAECRPGKCASGSCVIEGVSAGFCFIAADGGKGACIADGTTNPDAPCERCVAAVVQDKWSPIAAGTACKADDIACTQDACDGKGDCVATPDDGACKDKDGPCVRGACDAAEVKGCKTVPLPTTATCTGDAFDCTVEYCDGQGACAPKQNPDDTACNDGLTCTVDSCDPNSGAVDTGCVHKQVDTACDDGNLCTADTCAGATGEAGSGCSYIPNAA